MARRTTEQVHSIHSVIFFDPTAAMRTTVPVQCTLISLIPQRYFGIDSTVTLWTTLLVHSIYLVFRRLNCDIADYVGQCLTIILTPHFVILWRPSVCVYFLRACWLYGRKFLIRQTRKVRCRMCFLQKTLKFLP